MNKIIAKEQQIIYLLKFDAATLVRDVVPKKDLSKNSYKEVFNISKNDMLCYVLDRNVLWDYARVTESDDDGFYVIKGDDGAFTTYWQERRIHFGERAGLTFEEVATEFVDYATATSGAGSFVKWKNESD